MAKVIKGYKAFNADMTCRGMQYEIGREYKMDESPVVCERGYHFCKSISDCYSFYDTSDDTIICEVKALGEVVTDDEVKFCTNHIKIVRKVANARQKSNASVSSSGFCNSGNWNSGDWNSGNCNSGDRNSGNCNSGDCNSGNWNSGNRNSGNWNSGNCNSGVFCTEKNPKIKIFDSPSAWTMDDWIRSEAFDVMSECPYTHSEYINESSMTDEEKDRHPEYKTIGGYIKTITVTNEDKQAWWDSLPEEKKQAVYDLPNFDKEKFKECTGIEVV